MFGKQVADYIFFLIILIFSSVSFADTRTDQPTPLFGDANGTNAGRYRSVKFTNGSTTNNGDGSVTVSTGGGVSGYATIQDEGTPLTQESTVNFIGTPITCVDNAGATRTDCTITGTGGSSQWITVANVGIGTTDNVGIGSLNPGSKLDVQGTVRALFFNNMAITAPATSSTLTIANGKTLTASNTLTLAGTDSTTMTFPSTTATIARTDAAQTFTGHNTFEGVTPTGATGTGLMVFGSAPTITSPVITNLAPAADFTLTQNSIAALTSVNSGAVVNTLYLKAGNVGISSITPGQQLDVQGTIRSTNMIDTGVTASKVVVTNGSQQFTAATNLTDTAYSTAVGANPSATVGTSAVNGSSANFMRADGAPAINLTMSPTWTGNHNFAPSSGNTLFSAGNVGIGTATPGQVLDVNGLIRSTSAGSVSLPSLIVSTNGNGIYAPSANTFSITTNATQRIFVDSSGNVGIGSAAPGQMLDVAQAGRFLGSGNTQLNPTSGNVGIGSANPGQILDVQGNIRIAKLGSTLAVASGTNGCQGQSTLSSGIVTVSTTCTPSTSQGIFLTDAQSSITNVGSVTIATVSAGTSFVVQSTNVLDSSKVNWFIENSS